ncbi:MAG: glycerate kinase [Oscillospiraceae bacterium]|nr:glycerate kinase [Oscillospiraceae bacterium]
MNYNKMRDDAERIACRAIGSCLPDEAVKRALSGKSFSGRVMLVAAGKAAWQMAKAAAQCTKIDGGIVITKYGHVMGEIPGVRCFEAAHPVPDEVGVLATERALELIRGLSADDTVLFLLSGGGSALFEKPLVSLDELRNITNALLASGAEITEINSIRKRLSAVKGGRFALACAPAKVEAVILSDILGDPVDMIASGPVSPDSSSCADALEVVRKYGINMSESALELMNVETPKYLDNVKIKVVGSVRELCRAAEREAASLGYQTFFLTDMLSCEAKEAGRMLASIAQSHAGDGRKAAYILGGETVVHLTGDGMGGRNQELALAAAEGLSGINACVISVGSDGTDGPTDAAGGYADGETLERLNISGISYYEALRNNDAYNALKAVDGLIFTGPTGTNVNDVSVLLIGGADR